MNLAEHEFHAPETFTYHGLTIAIAVDANRYHAVSATCPTCKRTFRQHDLLHDELHAAVTHVARQHVHTS